LHKFGALALSFEPDMPTIGADLADTVLVNS